jgi:hypothetical protein
MVRMARMVVVIIHSSRGHRTSLTRHNIKSGHARLRSNSRRSEHGDETAGPWEQGNCWQTYVCWNITPCKPLTFKGQFGGTCRLHPQGRRISQAERLCMLSASCWFLAWLILPWRLKQHVAPKRRQHGVISQKRELLITTAVRTIFFFGNPLSVDCPWKKAVLWVVLIGQVLLQRLRSREVSQCFDSFVIWRWFISAA